MLKQGTNPGEIFEIRQNVYLTVKFSISHILLWQIFSNIFLNGLKEKAKEDGNGRGMMTEG